MFALYDRDVHGGSGQVLDLAIIEPILMVLTYGKGRIFHTVMGHDLAALNDVGFMTTYQRGTEWAATGKVTQKVPADFPTADKTSTRE